MSEQLLNRQPGRFLHWDEGLACVLSGRNRFCCPNNPYLSCVNTDELAIRVYFGRVICTVKG